jgi:hypothetical protein
MKRISENEYYKLLAGTKEGKDNSSSLAENPLKIALETREFEIELYWRRATYFWAFIAAAFAAFGVAQTIDYGPAKALLSVLFCCLGLIFSYSWYLVNRGSKFWQENWENHVALLEDRVYGPLFKTIVSRDEAHSRGVKFWIIGPAPYSVSKINQIVSLCVTVFWFLLLCLSMPFGSRISAELWLYLFAAITIFSGVLLRFWGRSDRHKVKGEPDNLLKPMKYESKIKDRDIDLGPNV